MSDPVAVSRPGGHRRQRHILGRGDPRHAGLAAAPERPAAERRWRIAFLLGPVLARVILLVRRKLPESVSRTPWFLRSSTTSRRPSAQFYLIAFAAGNLLGPLTIGRFFDIIGRKRMIAGTFIVSGLMLAITAYLFNQEVLTATTQTIAWCVIFFLLRFGRGQRGLPDSQRNLPAGGQGPGHCDLLRDRAVLRRCRPAVLRPPDRRRK
jgi:hypothetical protein